MNTAEDSTASATAPDFEKAFDALENPISELAGRVRCLDRIVNRMVDSEEDEQGYHRIYRLDMEVASYLLQDVFNLSQALDKQWMASSDCLGAAEGVR